MGIIARSTKAGSTTSFATSASLGNVQQVANLDNDLDAIYSEVNGDLTDDNLADNAVTSSKIANSAVTEAKIASDAVETSKLADGAVTTQKVFDQAITAVKIALGTITAVRAAINFSYASDLEAGVPAWVVPITSAAEHALVSTTPIVTRGGVVRVEGVVSCTIQNVSTQSGSIRFNILRDLTTVHTFDISNIQLLTVGQSLPLFIPIFFLNEGVPAGSYVYSVTAHPLDANWIISTSGSNPGRLYATELA